MSQATTPAPSGELSVESRKSEFVPVTGGAETTSAEALLLTAYILMWALVFGFVWLTARRQKNLDERLGLVEQALREADGQASIRGTERQE